VTPAERDALWRALLAECQRYGRTTSHTEDLLDLVLDSLVGEDE
jgi:hypothetical protein